MRAENRGTGLRFPGKQKGERSPVLLFRGFFLRGFLTLFLIVLPKGLLYCPFDDIEQEEPQKEKNSSIQIKASMYFLLFPLVQGQLPPAGLAGASAWGGPGERRECLWFFVKTFSKTVGLLGAENGEGPGIAGPGAPEQPARGTAYTLKRNSTMSPSCMT